VTGAHPDPYPGNAYDKYGSANPVVRAMMRGFFGAFDELVDHAAPAELLDVGCGEGVVTVRTAERLAPGTRVVGMDRDVPELRAVWPQRPDVTFTTGDARALDFADDEFDMVSLVEMLQLVDDAQRALAEAARVARRWVLVTTPREPLWRVLNVARGAYVRHGGNTPGHLHHWSRRGIVSLLGGIGRVELVRSPAPWVLTLVRVG
jgi:ubiquinone/menaquinone biosynthesis C-methylase UbiE